MPHQSQTNPCPTPYADTQAVCAPARTTLRTGCTIERTGIQHNDLAKEHENSVYFDERVKALEGLDHVLVERLGYVSEYYGKHHMPQALMVGKKERANEHLIQYNDYDYDLDEFYYMYDTDGRKLRRYLQTFENRGEISKDPLLEGDQIDSYTGYPYSPIDLDSRARYKSPTGTTLSEGNGFHPIDVIEPNVMGLNSLSAEYTPTHFIGDTATKALARLKKKQQQEEEEEGDNPDHYQPWFLTVSFNSPHPPFLPAW
jgi:hypothetical protein